MEREGTFRTCCGRTFQARAAANGNHRSPRVERRVDGTSRVDVSADRKCWRVLLWYLCRLNRNGRQKTVTVSYTRHYVSDFVTANYAVLSWFCNSVLAILVWRFGSIFSSKIVFKVVTDQITRLRQRLAKFSKQSINIVLNTKAKLLKKTRIIFEYLKTWISMPNRTGKSSVAYRALAGRTVESQPQSTTDRLPAFLLPTQ